MCWNERQLHRPSLFERPATFAASYPTISARRWRPRMCFSVIQGHGSTREEYMPGHAVSGDLVAQGDGTGIWNRDDGASSPVVHRIHRHDLGRDVPGQDHEVIRLYLGEARGGENWNVAPRKQFALFAGASIEAADYVL